MTEPKLLTEAEWRNVFAYNADIAITYIRERGFVADDPVDPDLLEAREICASMPGVDALQAVEYRSGRWDAGGMVAIALAAIKRGKELAQPKPLTREMVAKAHQKALGDFGSLSIHSLHTALVEQMK